jgi:hypothetical protein
MYAFGWISEQARSESRSVATSPERKIGGEKRSASDGRGTGDDPGRVNEAQDVSGL